MRFYWFPKWYPHPELNGDQRFRKPLLYPFELWGRNPSKYGLLRLCAANHEGHILLGCKPGASLFVSPGTSLVAVERRN